MYLIGRVLMNLYKTFQKKNDWKTNKRKKTLIQMLNNVVDNLE